MNERRSMGNALKMTPEMNKLSPDAVAFIKGGLPSKEQKPAVEPVLDLKPEKPVEAAVQELAPESAPEPREGKTRRTPKTQSAPQYLTNRITVSVTTRLEQRTADALRRAHLEQKLKNVRPATQQEIIEIAVQAWLKENSYLD